MPKSEESEKAKTEEVNTVSGIVVNRQMLICSNCANPSDFINNGLCDSCRSVDTAVAFAKN